MVDFTKSKMNEFTYEDWNTLMADICWRLQKNLQISRGCRKGHQNAR